MGLDDRRHAQGVGALDERLQDERLEAGVQDEHVGPVSARLVDLIGGDDDIIGQHRHLHGSAHRVQVRQAPVRADRLGDHRDAGGPSGLVEASENGDIPHPGQIGEGRGGALDLGDHGDDPPGCAQHRGDIARGGDGTGPLAQLPQRSGALPGGDGGARGGDQVVEGHHGSPPPARVIPANCEARAADVPAALIEVIVPGGGRLRQIRSADGTLPRDRAEIATRLEAGALTGVARGSDLVHLDQQGVAIAVDANGLDVLAVARGIALAPVLPTGAGPECDAALGQRAAQRLVVHPSDHEHLTGVVLLDHGNDES